MKDACHNTHMFNRRLHVTAWHTLVTSSETVSHYSIDSLMPALWFAQLTLIYTVFPFWYLVTLWFCDNTMSEPVEIQCFAQGHVDGIMLVNSQLLTAVGIKWNSLPFIAIQFTDLLKVWSSLQFSSVRVLSNFTIMGLSVFWCPTADKLNEFTNALRWLWCLILSQSVITTLWSHTMSHPQNCLIGYTSQAIADQHWIIWICKVTSN